MLSAEQMQALPDFFKAIPDPRRAQGRRRNGIYHVPSESIIRDVLIRVDPIELDKALQQWNAVYGKTDTSLDIDGKTLANAIDEEGGFLLPAKSAFPPSLAVAVKPT